MTGKIFISYRRADSSWAVRSLDDRLTTRFDHKQIFMDVDLYPGIDFFHAITENVGSCDVLLAVIGERWLTATDEDGKRRLDNPKDFVRLEIGIALKRGIPVIPVLLDRASMPQSRDLPDDLKAFVHRIALQLSHDRFGTDSMRMIDSVELALEKHETENKERLEAERRQRLEEAEGGSLTTEEVAAKLGLLARQSVQDRRRKGRLVAWRTNDKQWRFPAWQFGQNGLLLEGVAECIEATGLDNEWSAMIFFLSAADSLGGSRPLDLLRQGATERAIDYAKRYNRHDD